MILANYHTHTKFCDGLEMPKTYVREAIRLNMKTLGFSAHAPLPFHCPCTLPIEKYEEYKNVISQLKNEFSDSIEILCGLEIDYIPDLWKELEGSIVPSSLDYFVGSIHFIDTYPDGTRWTIDGSNERFRKGWEEIFAKDSSAVITKLFKYTREMISVMKPSIIGHFDKIKVQNSKKCIIDENDGLYRAEVLETLQAIEASDCVVEVNTRGVYRRNEAELYPSFWILELMAKMNIPVVINSDAHRASELVNHFEYAADKLRKAGFKSRVYLTGGEWFSVKL